MRIHVFQHYSIEDIGSIQAWAEKRGHSITRTRFYEVRYSIPAESEYDFLIIMGGPMSVNEEEILPWLKDEKAAVRRAIDSDKYILGVCLGSQLLANVLGAQVIVNPQKEIGWIPIEWDDQALKLPLFKGFQKNQTVLHWHGETFHLPPGVIPLAKSAACANQGFVYKDKVLAIQFHMELARTDLERMVKEFFMELVPAPYIQSANKMLAPDVPLDDMESSMHRLLDNWFSAKKNQG